MKPITLNSFKDLSKKFYEEKGIPEPKPFFKKKHHHKPSPVKQGDKKS